MLGPNRPSTLRLRKSELEQSNSPTFLLFGFSGGSFSFSLSFPAGAVERIQSYRPYASRKGFLMTKRSATAGLLFVLLLLLVFLNLAVQ